MAIQYKRILLKVSGEALSGPKGTGFDEETIASICAGIKAAHDLGAQIGIVVGGGNFWRGRSSGKMDRMDADKIGMLATVMNALAVKDALRQQGVPAVVMTSSFMPQVAEVFTSDKAIAALEGVAEDDWKTDNLHETLNKALVEEGGYKPRLAFGPVRVAMSGRRVSPPLFESMEIVGKDVSMARLKGLREHL